jgi:alginate O-acetyltransferase complex protein AlgI
MLFQSPIFAFFLALLIPAYLLASTDRARRVVLLVFSWWFYAHFNWRYLFLLLISTVVDYFVARAMQRHDDQPARRKRIFVASLIANIGMLAVFKYGRFLLETIGLDGSFLPEDVPPGISFYTFQTMSYTIDVYRRRTEPERDFVSFAVFVSFFPQLVAGPIVRATEFLPQTSPMPAFRLENVALGFQRFTLGMFKKVVIADNASLFVNAVFLAPGREDTFTLFSSLFAFSLVVYCDFSAYTDMALGLAQAFGFKFPENFDNPYHSRSMTEFWRRWHMTLSRWLRDYLYFPLGGSRDGEFNAYRNLFITMFIAGIWHGAKWTIIVWGIIHGLLLVIERRFRIGDPERDAKLGFVAGMTRMFLTFMVFNLLWIIFRNPDFASATFFAERLLTACDLAAAKEFGYQLVFGWLPYGESAAAFWTKAMLFFAIGQSAVKRFHLVATWHRLPWAIQALVLAALWLGCSAFFVDEVKFMYFQF